MGKHVQGELLRFKVMHWTGDGPKHGWKRATRKAFATTTEATAWIAAHGEMKANYYEVWPLRQMRGNRPRIHKETT